MQVPQSPSATMNKIKQTYLKMKPQILKIVNITIEIGPDVKYFNQNSDIFYSFSVNSNSCAQLTLIIGNQIRHPSSYLSLL